MTALEWAITQRAVERYVERVAPAASLGAARRAVERAASSASRLARDTDCGDEQWRGGEPADPPVVLVVKNDESIGRRVVVTVLGGKRAEAMMQNQKTWGELLQSEMAKAGMNAAALAERCGVERRAVEAWCANERAPSGSALPRLYAALRTMRAHQVQLVALRMKLKAAGVAVSEDEPAVKMAGPIEPAPVETAAPEPPRLVKVERDPRPVAVAAEVPRHDDEAPAVVAPWSFGQALRRARKADGMSMREVGDLVGATMHDVHHWEHDRRAPSAEQIAKLVALFPTLTGLVPAPKAVAPARRRRSSGRRGAYVGATLRAEMARTGENQEQLAARIGVGRSHMSRLCRDETKPSRNMRAKIVAALAARPGAVVRGAPAVVRAPEPVVVPSPEPAAKADGSPVKRWLQCVKAVKGAAYRADLVELLRLAGEAGLGLEDVVDAVALGGIGGWLWRTRTGWRASG